MNSYPFSTYLVKYSSSPLSRGINVFNCFSVTSKLLVCPILYVYKDHVWKCLKWRFICHTGFEILRGSIVINFRDTWRYILPWGNTSKVTFPWIMKWDDNLVICLSRNPSFWPTPFYRVGAQDPGYSKYVIFPFLFSINCL